VFCNEREYRFLIGGAREGLLLILASFFIMGGFHVIGYTALLCVVLSVLFILPTMAITKLLRA
jgi:hypothetical protein